MNLIIIPSGEAGSCRHHRLRPISVLLVASGLLGGLALFVVGYLLGQGNIEPLRHDWQSQIVEQRFELEGVRTRASAEIEVLTTRVARIQAQVARIEAVGNRLLKLADLDEGEFDFTSEPAVGGAAPSVTNPVKQNAILVELDQLANRLANREEQLKALDRALLDRSLYQRIQPNGSPVSEGWISSRYGYRSDPFSGKSSLHRGIDFAARRGTEIKAVAGGIVIQSSYKGELGLMVSIDHGNGYVTRYGHNSKNLVEVGEVVSKGQAIALLGSTGRSTGPHVHFEVIHNGKHQDPADYLESESK